MNIEKIREIAAEVLMDKKSHPWKERGNKFQHGERTGKIAVELRKRILPDDDSHDEIMLAAALFHDVANGDVERDEHGKVGAEQTRKLIKEFCTEEELNEICRLIEVHDDRYPDSDRYPYWVKLHQDADYLDHLGTYDIWMCSIECARQNRTVTEAADYFANKRPGELLAARCIMNYEISRRVLDEKVEFQRAFAERFVREMNGEVVGLDELWQELDDIE